MSLDNGPAELIGHVICTRTPSASVTDASMAVPPDWETKKSSLPGPDETEPLGHQEEGGTIALHSLAIATQHQRKGLGTVLLKSFVQRIKESKLAERISLLAHDHLIDFYKSHGFQDMGPSKATFGGGGWNNMVRIALYSTILYSQCSDSIFRRYWSLAIQKTTKINDMRSKLVTMSVRDTPLLQAISALRC